MNLDKYDIEDIRRTASLISEIRHGRYQNPDFSTELPKMIGLKLTNRCNLRCKHCYEWSKTGFHRLMDDEMQNDEISIECIEKILEETSVHKSSLYLWGGEPLLYSCFDNLATLLSKDKRKITICTNGLLISEKIHQIEIMSGDMDVIFALDGFEEENDAIRGNHVFRQAVDGIKKLVQSKEDGRFGGKVIVHLVINDSMVSKLYDFVEFLQNIGVDSVIMCYPWYISDEIAEKMDSYYDCLQFAGVCKSDSYSWHHFKYRLSSDVIDDIVEQANAILAHKWNMRVRFFPNIREREKIVQFITSNVINEEVKCKQCVALASRIDLLPGDYITSCKHFPEFIIGKYDGAIKQIWKCEKYNQIRKEVDKQLMPVCSMCNLLYLYDF